MAITGNSITIFISFLICVFYTSCGPRLSSNAEEYLSLSSEYPECTTHFSYSPSTAINGTAHFYKRATLFSVDAGVLENMLLGDPLTSPLPIPYAEVAVYDQNKNLVQCGRTDVDGNIVALSGSGSLTLPKKAQNYTLRVYARTKFTLPLLSTVMPTQIVSAHVSVKEDVYTNKVYFVQTEFYSDGTSTSPIELLAKARQTDSLAIEGGAFNIYNDLIQSYLYIDEKMSGAGGAGVDLSCLTSKANVFWKAGFNPFQYIYPNENPTTLSSNSSFYNPDDGNLYITGGQVGDVSLANTDHFDDFAIVHELAHWIENQCGHETFGGFHSLTVRIDPRLAWHEGFANYFSAAVLKNRMSNIDPTMDARLAEIGETSGWTFLFNSYGFADSFQNTGNGSGFLMDLKKAGTSPGDWQIGVYLGSPFDKVNPTLYPGEGHFREGAITRSLFKTTQWCVSCAATTATSGTELPLPYVWASFDNDTGIGQSFYPFISSNSFFENIKIFTTQGPDLWTTNYKSFVNAEALQLFSDNQSTSGTYISVVSATSYINWVPYGHELSLSSSNSCTSGTLIQGRTDDPTLTGTNSDQRYSNHFYTIRPYQLSGLNSLSVTFEKIAGTNIDHDLILFRKGYTFNDDYSCVGGATSSGYCSSGSYSPIRTLSDDVILSDRSASSNLSTSYTKIISGMSLNLNSSQEYILNIRAYTAGKSLSSATSYKYTIKSNLTNGANTLGVLCPQ